MWLFICDLSCIDFASTSPCLSWCGFVHEQELTAVNRTLLQLVDEHHVLEAKIRELQSRDRPAAFHSAPMPAVDAGPAESASAAVAAVSAPSSSSSLSSATSIAAPVSVCTTLVPRSVAGAGSSVGDRDPGDELFGLPTWSFEVDVDASTRTDMQLI
jgi:hypothetical protein